MPPYTRVYTKQFLEIKLFTFDLREWSRYQCFIRPKVHFAPEFSFNLHVTHPPFN